jgi:hypothetical protein
MIITYRITEGPSKFDLMSSLFDGKVVQFTQEIESNKKTVSAVITVIEMEDGSRESWNIKMLVKESSTSSIQVGKSLSAYYSSRNRQGNIRLNK